MCFLHQKVEYDLFKLLKKKVFFTMEEMKCLMFKVFEGLAYLHKKKIFHRDIKGVVIGVAVRIDANILINKDGEVKICDFGLARKFSKEDGSIPYSDDKITMCYRPPEVLLHNEYYDSKIDIWSAGCVFMNQLKHCIFLVGKNEEEVFRRIIPLCGARMDVLDGSAVAAKSDLEYLRTCKGFNTIFSDNSKTNKIFTGKLSPRRLASELREWG